MSHWDDVRAAARRRHAEACLAGQDHDIPAATALLERAACLTGVPCKPLRAGHKLLDGAEAVFDATYGATGVIWINRDVPTPTAAFYAAHEYAHVWLHRGHAHCTGGDLDPLDADDEAPSGVQRVEGYSLHERREREANAFAHEFLLPADRLRRWHLADGRGAMEIATRVDVSPALVYHQLARALLLPAPTGDGDVVADGPNDAGETGDPGHLAADLDESQAEAASVARGPFLLEAGPGTGKTRTLVARITHLVETAGVEPGRILALTFSNRAAEEMRARVAAVAPEAAPRIWMGTFHAFGLELLRKYGERIGLDAPRVLEPIDAIAALEDGLVALDLHHYQNLYEPAMHLRAILAAIARAKDEAVAPEGYAALAEAMLAAAETDSERVAAERALEVARAYRYYQDYLEREGLLDFGDLIARAIALLRADPLVKRDVRRGYAQILVDEYQDVNRASALLLKEIAGDGAGLWVVGDVRQAIYRFRGAAPANMRLFATQDFPGAQVRTLRHNYRSLPAIVETVAEMAPRMAATAGQPFAPWQVRRSGTGTVRLEVAADDEAEGRGVAAGIARQHAGGVPYRDQAVLCRTHTMLARLAARLEAAGIPVLYLGPLFERPEVRDLLALLSLCSEGHGRGLVRVARFPQYDVPLADVRAVLRLAREHDVPFPRALTLAHSCEAVSARGKAGLALLARHLDGAWSGRGAWTLLVEYLFERGRYLRDRLTGDDVAAQQRRLAVYQLVQFAQEQRRASLAPGQDRTRAFLAHVRRLVMFGEERELRQVPEAAGGIDAVRLLTVHASKGLEFRAVYVPGLADGLFPLRQQGEDCPPPRGMLDEAVRAGYAEEEECLFFVAISRARDALRLSLAGRYGKAPRRPSRLLDLIDGAVTVEPPSPPPNPGAADGAAPQDGTASAANRAAADECAKPLVPTLRPVFEARLVEVYLGCPRRFYYEHIVGLGGRTADSAYVRFYRCVYAVVEWIQEQQDTGRTVDEDAAQAHLALVWEEQGPRDHAYAPLYWQSAMAMVARAVRGWGSSGRGGRRAARPAWEVALAHGSVTVKPDRVEVSEDDGGTQRVVVQRLRTGRLTATETDQPIYGLYQRAVERAYPGADRRVQMVSLATGEVREVDLKPRAVDTRLKKYDAAIAGILHGEFPAHPDPRACPQCPFYFICGV